MNLRYSNTHFRRSVFSAGLTLTGIFVSGMACAQEDKPPGKDGTISASADLASEFHIAVRTSEAFRAAAEKLLNSKEVKSSLQDDCKSILLIGSDDLAARAYFVALNTQVAQLEKRIHEVMTQTRQENKAVTGLGGAIEEAAAAVSILRLFRVDRTISPKSTQLGEQVLLDQLASISSCKCPTDKKDATVLCVNYPAGTLGLDGGEGGKISEAVNRIFRSREELESRLVARNGTDAHKAQIKALLDQLNGLETELHGAMEKRNFNRLQWAVHGERVESAWSSVERVLKVAILAQGGMTMRDSSIWRTDRLYASGGVLISWKLLTKKNGKPVEISEQGLERNEVPLKRIPLKQE